MILRPPWKARGSLFFPGGFLPGGGYSLSRTGVQCIQHEFDRSARWLILRSRARGKKIDLACFPNSLPDKLRPSTKFALAENQDLLNLRHQQMYFMPLSKCINPSTREKVSKQVDPTVFGSHTRRPRVPLAHPI